MIYPRGGGTQLAEVEWSTISWGRQVDGISTAQVKVAGITGRGPDCCGIVSSIEPWQHELGIIRTTAGGDSFRVWCGPVQTVQFDPDDSATISASDLAVWLTRRQIHDDHIYAGEDLAVIFADYVYDAMLPENSVGLIVATSLCGVTGDRVTLAASHVIAYDQIAEISRTGIDWTCIDRYMLAGGLVLGTDPIATLVDEHFITTPSSSKDGSNASTYQGIIGGGTATADQTPSVYGSAGGIDPDYGLLEVVANEDTILDAASADFAAGSKLALNYGAPSVITHGVLGPDAPLDLGPLLAGSPVTVRLQRNCVAVDGTYRLSQIDVTADERGAELVKVSFQPIGTS